MRTNGVLRPGLLPAALVLAAAHLHGSSGEVTEAALADALGEIDEALNEVDWMLEVIATTGGNPEMPPVEKPGLLHHEYRLTLGWGFDSNVLLSAENAVESSYLRPALDLNLVYLRPGWGELILSAFYDGRQFLDADVAGEHLGLAEGRWRVHRGPWSGSLVGAFTFAEYVFDAAEADTALRRDGIIKERTPELGVSLARELGTTGVLELGLRGGAARFVDTSEDYDTAEVRWTARWAPASSVILRGWLSAERRAYTEARARTARSFWFVGEDGETRLLRTTVLEAVVWPQWRFAPAWTLSAPAAYQRIDDDEGGYFDRQRASVRARIEWAPPPWRFAVEAGLLWMNYDSRTRTPVDLESQWQRKGSADVELGRSLGTAWEVYARARFSEVDANLSELQYQSWSGECGLSFGF